MATFVPFIGFVYGHFLNNYMKNKIFFACLALLIFLSASCSKGKSYVELLKEEQTAISRFIDDNNFVILDKFPADTVFAANEFYKTSDGLYVNIIQKGIPLNYIYNENIYLDVKDFILFKNDTTHYDLGVFRILYNNTYSYTFEQNSNIICDGILYPLQYVGYEGKAKLIIPSKQSTSYYQSQVTPLYIGEVTYRTNIDRVSE